MNDPYVTTEERLRRRDEKEKRYKACMKVLRPMGFERNENLAFISGAPWLSVRLDDEVFRAIKTPGEFMVWFASRKKQEGIESVQAEFRKLIGVLQ